MESNGILAQVPGQYIAQAINTLPPAATADDQLYEVVIEAGHIGLVRLFACRQRARHHRHSHWFWSVVRAESVSDSGACDAPRQPSVGE